MKKHIITLFSLCAIALMGWSCETDFYNENYLDGYESDDTITDVQQIEYTLAEADYATIAKNSTNKATAEATGSEAVAALAAVGTNKYFANPEQAGIYIPAFIAATYPTLDDTSVAMVTYRTALDVPAEITALNAAQTYTLAADDYKAIWGSETNYESAVTPATIAKIPEALATVFAEKGIAAGEYVAVTYNYSEKEPSTGDDDSTEEPENPNDPEEPTPDQPTVEYTNVLGTAELNEAVTVTGYVSAISWQGPILTDKGGSVLIFDKANVAMPDVVVGDVITVSGTISAYNNGFQIAATNNDGSINTATTISKTGKTVTAAYPTEVLELTGAKMDELLTTRTTNEYAHFAKMTGKLSVSGNYYNFNVDGAETAVGSLYGVTDALKAVLTDGMECTLYGYFITISKSGGAPKYINLVVTHVNEEPNFDNGEEPTPDQPAIEFTNVLGTAALNDAVTVTGYVSAVSWQGPIVTDNGGSVLLYDKANAAYPDAAIGDVVTVTGTIGAYNNGFQIAAVNSDGSVNTATTITKVGTTTFSYPTDVLELTGAKMDELLTTRTTNEYAKYAKMTGTLSVSGNYYNFNVDGATTAVGSLYGVTDALKAVLTDGLQCTLYGYFITISKSGGAAKYINLVVTDVVTTAMANAATALQSEKKYGFYQWNGSAFTAVNMAIVQPSDFAEMGQTYGSFTNPAQDNYLPKFLGKNYPYGQEGDAVNVGYLCYSGGATSWRVDEYINDGQQWVKTIYFADMVGQFRRTEGQWKEDRTLELSYTEMGTAEYKAFCQYCCNWVYDFVDVPLGAPARDNAGVIISSSAVTVGGAKPSGAYWVSNYGNNEWYAGTYAYYGEMNWSGSKARATWENLGYTGLSDDEIVTMMQNNAAIVFQNVLGYMYPEMTANEYNSVIVKVYDYISKANWAYTFKVVGTGTFEYVEGSLTKL